MKRARGLPPFDQVAMDAALATAPDRLEEVGLPYDPNDAEAVEAFFKDAVTSHSLPELRTRLAEQRRTRGLGRAPAKVLTTIRFDRVDRVHCGLAGG